VTERIRLTTDILIAPLRSNTALFAKQAATVDNLSGGRLVLGLAVGGRPDDYEVSDLDFHARGEAFDRQLAKLTELWAGDSVGPAPGNGKRPSLLIGGQADRNYERAARYADGWSLGGGTPDALSQGKAKLERQWSAAGREGKPRAVVLMYFGLGDDAEQMAQQSLGSYYAFLGDYAQTIVRSAAKDPETVRQYLTGFEQAGADEVICFPVSAELSQVDRLAEAAGL
jgi:alkanesulfonate monooxygenase SsuD/methylene tetrahydromethanopterin reductase-like flavin-dependent oxidoreductase (luciferase family)